MSSTRAMPSDWPEVGEYDGRPVNVREFVATQPRARLVELVIDVPGVGPIRPFRFVGDREDIVIGEDGILRV